MSRSRGPYIQAKRKILAMMEARADANGIVRGISHYGMTQLAGVGGGSVSLAVSGLIDDGKITRLVTGSGSRTAVYRLGGTPKIQQAAEAHEPSGIEAVTWLMPNRNYLGSANELQPIEISLPRLRCLERGIE